VHHTHFWKVFAASVTEYKKIQERFYVRNQLVLYACNF